MLWCRAVLVGVFLVSAVTKLSGRASLAAFIWWVESLRLLPRGWSRQMADAAVAAELAAAILTAVPATASRMSSN